MDPGRLQLHAWKLSGDLSEKLASPGIQQRELHPLARPCSPSPIYDGKWCIFCAWCGGRETDPFIAYILLIAEFLTYLFWDKQLAPGTKAGYRAAIASAFKHTGLPDVGHDPALTAVLASSRKRPRRPRFLPQWDLSLVLMALTRALFEPLQLAVFGLESLPLSPHLRSQKR